MSLTAQVYPCQCGHTRASHRAACLVCECPEWRPTSDGEWPQFSLLPETDHPM